MVDKPPELPLFAPMASSLETAVHHGGDLQGSFLKAAALPQLRSGWRFRSS